MRKMPVLHGGTPNIPSDQANAIAFDADGNIYVGTQCDGLAIAHAADNYTTWRVITGPDRMPTVPRGEGPPTNLINDVLVTRDGTLFVATMLGVAQSRDRGRTLTYSRGADLERQGPRPLRRPAARLDGGPAWCRWAACRTPVGPGHRRHPRHARRPDALRGHRESQGPVAANVHQGQTPRRRGRTGAGGRARLAADAVRFSICDLRLGGRTSGGTRRRAMRDLRGRPPTRGPAHIRDGVRGGQDAIGGKRGVARCATYGVSDSTSPLAGGSGHSHLNTPLPQA